MPEFHDRGLKALKTEMATVRWENFVERADEHYFVARVLFSQWLPRYGSLCAQQCVENYLKAYMRASGRPAELGHRLTDLLQSISAWADEASFLRTDYLTTICNRYDPFYEVARYPVHKTGPKNAYGFISGDGTDESILDYFVYKMREELGRLVSIGHLDPPGRAFFLGQAREHRPALHQMFEADNLNLL